jgi:hypothetical protein
MELCIVCDASVQYWPRRLDAAYELASRPVVVAQAGQRIRDELMNLLPRNIAQVEVFILQIMFTSLNLPVSVTLRYIRFMRSVFRMK